MSSVFSPEYTEIFPEISLGKDDRVFNFFILIIVLITFIIIIIPWNKIGKNKENMSGGTVAQMFAQDSQDVYLKGNVDKYATGNFTLAFNQPTRQANVQMNRGSPLYSIILPDTPMNPNPYSLEASNNYTENILNDRAKKMTFTNPVLTLKDVLPNTTNTTNTTSSVKSKIEPKIKSANNKHNKKLANSTSVNSVPTIPKNILPSSLPLPADPNMPPNPYELAKIAKQVAVKKTTADNLPAMTKWKPDDYLFQAYTDRALYDVECSKDLAACGNGAGGYRLNSGFVQSTKAVNDVNIDGNIFYPDSYVGSYFITPSFDINKPYPVIFDNNRVN